VAAAVPRLVAGARREEHGGILLESEPLGAVRLELVADLAAGLVEPPADLGEGVKLLLRPLIHLDPTLAGHAIAADLDERVVAVQVDILHPCSIVEVGDVEGVHDLSQCVGGGAGLILEVRRRVQLGPIEQILCDHCPFLS
jgi:hypothetical protein